MGSRIWGKIELVQLRNINLVEPVLRNDALLGPILLAARLLMAAVFMLFGTAKVVDTAEMQQYMEANDVPGGLIYLAILVQIGAGVLVALGYYTRLNAVLLAGFCIVATTLFHSNFSDPNELAHFTKDLAIAGGFLFMIAFGPGPWSLDAYRERTRRQLTDAPSLGYDSHTNRPTAEHH